MRRSTLLAITATPLALVLGAVGSSNASAPRVAAPAPTHSHAAEIARLRAHFDSVLAELPATMPAGLSSQQRARRAALLTTLRDYRDAGVFPRNYDFPGLAVPYFVDRETGVLCAVAHLVASTGRRDIVDRVARADNNILVPQLAGDSAFNGWLDRHGLTLADAARIQVPYMMLEGTDQPSADRNGALTTGTSVALGGAAIASLLTARMNADGTSRLGNALGAIAGATALGMGAASLGSDAGSPTLGAATMIAGATSAWLSTRSIMRFRTASAAKRDADRATVAPLLPVDGTSGAGVSVTLRF